MSDLFTAVNPDRVKVGDRAEGVELLIDDNYSVFLSPAEARGLALKLVYMAALSVAK